MCKLPNEKYLKIIGFKNEIGLYTTFFYAHRLICGFSTQMVLQVNLVNEKGIR